MCFSAQASFSVGAVLVGIGALAWRSTTAPRERAFAAIPLLFGIQQFLEGVLWLTFHHDAPQLAVATTYAYSFFSQLFWPVYVPLAVLLIEPPGWRRRALSTGALIGLVVSTWLLYSMVTYGIVARLEGQHIEYVTRPDLGPLTMVMYLLSTGVCLSISSHRAAKAFGLLALLSYAMAHAIYALWFISVWCYFAALLSGVVLLHFRAGPALAAPARS